MPPPGRFAKADSVGPRALREYSENVFASISRQSRPPVPNGEGLREVIQIDNHLMIVHEVYMEDSRVYMKCT